MFLDSFIKMKPQMLNNIKVKGVGLLPADLDNDILAIPFTINAVCLGSIYCCNVKFDPSPNLAAVFYKISFSILRYAILSSLHQ